MKSWKLRERVCGGVENLGVLLDKEANKKALNDRASQINLAESKVQLWLVPTDEESVILAEIIALI